MHFVLEEGKMHFVLEKGNFLSAAESHLVTSIPLYRVSLGYRAPSSWKEEEGGGALHHHEVVSIVIGNLILATSSRGSVQRQPLS